MTLPEKPAILLVDDEPSVLFALSAVLEEEGFDVGCAGDGLTALEMFRKRKWDLLITDFSMPGINGQELAEAIRATAPEFPIILITGFRKPGMDSEVFDLVLEKPFSNQSLLAAARICLLKAQAWSTSPHLVA